MTNYCGRLIDHVHLRVANLEKSKVFYRAVLQALEMSELFQEGGNCFYADELYVDQGEEYFSRIHLAFQAGNPQQIAEFYRAALEAGGTENGGPAERHYHPGYYSAFVLDPDGNNIEAVYHGPSKRSAESIIVERLK